MKSAFCLASSDLTIEERCLRISLGKRQKGLWVDQSPAEGVGLDFVIIPVLYLLRESSSVWRLHWDLKC